MTSRRGFFRQLMGRTLGQAADLLGEPSPPPPRPRTRLRPPGALAEAQFLDACRRCGACVDVCPARAIQPVTGVSEELDGTPAITARAQPCLVCDGLKCMHACPSGALQPQPQERLGMGTAVVDDGACLRGRGQDCTVCVDLCPYGEAAMRIDDSGTVQVLGGCTGCGICEWKCPVEPAAVVVRPRA